MQQGPGRDTLPYAPNANITFRPNVSSSSSSPASVGEAKKGLQLGNYGGDQRREFGEARENMMMIVRRGAVEFVATMGFMFFATFLRIYSVDAITTLGGSLGIGFFYMAILFLFGTNHFPHMDPVISTVMLFFQNGFGIVHWIVFVGFQVAGAALGVLFAWIGQTGTGLYDYATINNLGGSSQLEVLYVESIGAYVFCFTIVSFIIDFHKDRQPGDHKIPVADSLMLGFLLAGLNIVFSTVSGASFNVLRWLFTDLYHGVTYDSFGSAWMYPVAYIIALAAVVMTKFIFVWFNKEGSFIEYMIIGEDTDEAKESQL